jgi:hypothetical protein
VKDAPEGFVFLSQVKTVIAEGPDGDEPLDVDLLSPSQMSYLKANLSAWCLRNPAAAYSRKLIHPITQSPQKMGSAGPTILASLDLSIFAEKISNRHIMQFGIASETKHEMFRHFQNKRRN